MVMEIILNAIVEYCLLLSLFVDLTRHAHFFRSTLVDWRVYFRLLSSTLHASVSYFLVAAKRIINTTFLYVATVTLLYLRIE